MPDVTIGSATKSIVAKHAKIYVIQGATKNFLAAAKNARLSYRFNPVQEDVCGSQYPYVLTGNYRGEFEAETIYTSDQLLELNKPNATTLEVPDVSVEIEGKDVVGPPQGVKRITCPGKIFGMEVVTPGDAEGVVRCRITSAVLTAFPTIVAV